MFDPTKIDNSNMNTCQISSDYPQICGSKNRVSLPLGELESFKRILLGGPYINMIFSLNFGGFRDVFFGDQLKRPPTFVELCFLRLYVCIDRTTWMDREDKQNSSPTRWSLAKWWKFLGFLMAIFADVARVKKVGILSNSSQVHEGFVFCLGTEKRMEFITISP